jgi:flagellar biosynthesis protein FlhG
MNQLQDFIQVIAFASGKGGAGKTTAAINVAAAMNDLGHKVMLLDADLGLANLDVMLGLTPQHNLSHVLKGEKQLDEVIIEGPKGLLIVPAASGIQKMAELSSAEHVGLIHAFNTIQHKIDTLIIDTAAGIDSGVTSFCKAAHEVVVVVCDEPASLTDAYALIKVLHRNHGVTRFRILANMVDSDQSGREIFNHLLKVTDRFLNVSLDFIGAIPRDDFQRKANQQQQLLSEAFPRAKTQRAWQQVATAIESWSVDPSPTGRFEFFFERLLTQNPSVGAAA